MIDTTKARPYAATETPDPKTFFYINLDEGNSTAEKYVYDKENNQLMYKSGGDYLPVSIFGYDHDGSVHYAADNNGDGKKGGANELVTLHAADYKFNAPYITYKSIIPTGQAKDGNGKMYNTSGEKTVYMLPGWTRPAELTK